MTRKRTPRKSGRRLRDSVLDDLAYVEAAHVPFGALAAAAEQHRLPPESGGPPVADAEDAPGVHVSDSDYVQLSRLVIEAAWRVDIGRADTLCDLFVDAGTLTMGETVLDGREQIREWGRDAVESNGYAGIRHVCGNMRFLATGADTAEGVTVLTVYFDADGSGPAGVGTSVPWTVGEDHDKFVRTDEGWRLTARTWVSLFERPPVGRC